MFGTYMGYMEFDGQRYWDIRDQQWLEVVPCEEKRLLSDSLHRKDLVALEQGMMDTAQTYKEELENLQRHDRKLRGEVNKSRTEKGKKIIY